MVLTDTEGRLLLICFPRELRFVVRSPRDTAVMAIVKRNKPIEIRKSERTLLPLKHSHSELCDMNDRRSFMI